MNYSFLSLDTIQTLVRAVMKIGGGVMMAKGVADESAVEAIGAGLVALVAVLWGVAHRGERLKAEGKRLKWDEKNLGEVQSSECRVQNGDLKELNMLLIIAVCALGLAGCAGPNAVAFRTEKLLTDTCYGAVVVWNTYYELESGKVSGTEAEKLERRNAEVWNASRRFAAAMMVADGIRESAATNNAASNRTALELALEVSREQSSNVVWLVRSYAK